MKRGNETDQNLINPEAERAILGRILADETVWWAASDRLSPEDFGLREHAETYRGMVALAHSSKAISIAALISTVKSLNPEYNEASIGSRLTSIMIEAGQIESRRIDTGQLIDIIRHRSVCRSMVLAADKIRVRALTVSTETPIAEVISEASGLIASQDIDDSAETPSLGVLMSRVISETEAARISGKPRGYSTGLRCFDEVVGPILPGNLIVIAGETGSGKTVLATQVAYLLAKQGLPGRMFSLEMDGTEIATRIITKQTKISSDRISTASVSELDTTLMMAAAQEIYDLPFSIDSRSGVTVGMINARTARAMAQEDIKYIVIDHLQYIRPDDGRAKENIQTKQVVDDLKRMAKRLGIPIFLISHISRQDEHETINTAADVKRPKLKMLYGSSAIEKAADAVVFVHRPSWHLERATPAERHMEKYRSDLYFWQNRAELVLPKRRSGPGFMIRECLFDSESTWFSDSSRPDMGL